MRTLQKRTVFYVQQIQNGNWVDLYCLDSQAEARKWIAKNNAEDTQILEVQSSTRHPEMVNKRFEQVGKPQEKTEVKKPKLVYKHKIMFQDDDCRNGWLDAISEKLVPSEYGLFENESHAYDVADMLWGEGLLSEYKIIRIGIYS